MVNGNPTTAAPGDDDHPIIFNGPGIFTNDGSLNITTNAGGGCGVIGYSDGTTPRDDVILSGGSVSIGTTAAADPGSLLLGGAAVPSVKAWASSGAYKEVATSSEVEELKKKIEELEKAENDRKDIEYFRRNLHGALKIPTDYMSIPKTQIGPDDLLIVHLGVKDIPPRRVEEFVKRAKNNAGFNKAGLKGRVLWVPCREETGCRFSVLGVENREEQDRVMKEAIDYAKATATWKPSTLVGAVNELKIEKGVLTQKDIETARAALCARKRKYPPPVMG